MVNLFDVSPEQFPTITEFSLIGRNTDEVDAMWEPHKGVALQSATGKELSALLPSVLDKAFKGEL